ncbi:MAG TPA: c-type cytochrome [Myxococcales bacterium]|nr:c-type cytochrome [Myxococcales bacterium]
MRSLLCAAAAALALDAAQGQPAALPRPPDPQRAARGAQVFDRFCVSCHGKHGDGRGYSAQWLDPAPRDFTGGIFKWRSTPSGTLPTDDDLVRTVSRGLRHTNMPSWAPLGERTVRDVVEYVKTFSPRWLTEPPGKPIVIPPAPPDGEQSRKRGAELYTQMGCFNCHGAKGKGDGPAMPTLLDDWGHKIVPFDFTGGVGLKCGDRPEDVYRVFMTGLTGSPMPSYAEQLSPDDAWHLVHYLQTLRMQ